jgi:thiol-disulfide isomerase/thioredoxin
MKITLLFVCLLAFVLVSKAQLYNSDLKNLKNNWVSIDNIKGEKLTVIDFWATWCKPCVSAIPKINSLNKKFEGRGVVFIGINTDGPRNQSKVKPLVKALKISYPILLDPENNLMNALNVNVLPTLTIYDSKGKNLYFHEGFTLGDENIIEQKINELIKTR